ncbi:Riboflavin biosynthesis protein RibD [compost metagenome]
MVGVGTILADNPQLTTRLAVPGISPVRIVVDSSLRIPDDSKVLTDGLAPTILLTTTNANEAKVNALQDRGIQVVVCGDGPVVDLPQAMKKLGELDISSILVEGGGRLNGAILQNELADEIVLFLAPKLIGGLDAPGSFMFEGYELMKDAITLQDLVVEQIGDNICVSGKPVYTA